MQGVYQKFDVEMVFDLACVMTTRYCVISSFVKNSKSRSDCNLECAKMNYYLLDEQNKRYEIITDNLDCLSKLVTSYNCQENANIKHIRSRHCVI